MFCCFHAQDPSGIFVSLPEIYDFNFGSSKHLVFNIFFRFIEFFFDFFFDFMVFEHACQSFMTFSFNTNFNCCNQIWLFSIKLIQFSGFSRLSDIFTLFNARQVFNVSIFSSLFLPLRINDAFYILPDVLFYVIFEVIFWP